MGRAYKPIEYGLPSLARLIRYSELLEPSTFSTIQRATSILKCAFGVAVPGSSVDMAANS